MNFYNEFDPHAAAWLRELIAAGLIPAGVVDERSITEIQPHELSEFTQCHFFAGIGGWSLALELAGWPATRPVWTGSCPCQPFSSAGQGKGGGDDRHLWPVFRRLIAELHPERVFGEQVAQAIGFNWLDGVSADLEADGYAVGAAVLGAHSVSAPHIRKRLYWVADSQDADRWSEQPEGGERSGRSGFAGGCVVGGGVAEPDSIGSKAGLSGPIQRQEGVARVPHDGSGQQLGRVANSPSLPRAQHEREPGGGSRGTTGPHDSAKRGGDNGGVGNPTSRGLGIVGHATQPGSRGHADSTSGAVGGMGFPNSDGRQPGDESATGARHGHPIEPASFWSDSRWILCRDGKHRRVPTESIFQFVSDGVSTILGHRWMRCVETIENQILSYATITKTDPGEALRTMWLENREAALQRQAGGHDQVPQPELLLFGLLQLAGYSRAKFHLSAQDFSEIERATMHLLRMHSSEPAKPACPPQERGLEGSLTGESGDALRGVPPEGAQPEGAGAVQALRHPGPEARDVSEALSAVQETWRRYVEESEAAGETERLRLGPGMLSAAGRFPLTSGEVFKLPKRGSIRPALLKGPGNAIVPEAAAEFIQAFLEITHP